MDVYLTSNKHQKHRRDVFKTEDPLGSGSIHHILKQCKTRQPIPGFHSKEFLEEWISKHLNFSGKIFLFVNTLLGYRNEGEVDSISPNDSR